MMETKYPEIIIVVGSGRSGTTYLAGLLKTCFDIGFASEPKFVIPFSRNIHKYGELADRRSMQSLIEAIIRTPPFRHLKQKRGITIHPKEIIDCLQGYTYTDVLYATFSVLSQKRGKSRLGYKDPADVVNIRALAQLLPTARFIHIVRDGRDVALSFLKFPWGPTNLYSAAEYWARSTEKGYSDGIALGSRYFELKYEDLILNTQETAWKLGEFVNEGQNSQQILSFIKQVEITKKVENVQVWNKKLDRKQIYLCEAASGYVLEHVGYDLCFEGKARLNWFYGSAYKAKDLLLRSMNRLKRDLQSTNFSYT